MLVNSIIFFLNICASGMVLLDSFFFGLGRGLVGASSLQ
uniref:Uncharacterized protein n=1 Tax=Rhizophora mucronata TaxID=61149 RepID=A0A2P2R0U5_RHIMU